MTDTLTKWERVALSKWGSYITDVESKTILQGSALAGPPAQALEVGCEGGRWSKLLADRGWQLTCTDVDHSALSICQRKVPAARCILASSADQRVPVGSGEFSLLLCVEVAPVIHSAWFCAEAARLLKPGGVLVGVSWNSASFRGVAHRWKSSIHGANEGVFYSESYSSLRARLKDSGFQFQTETGFCWGPFSRESNSALIPIFIGIERVFLLRKFPRISPWIIFTCQKAAIGSVAEKPGEQALAGNR
jgi:SAM-dependent methyltransferase